MVGAPPEAWSGVDRGSLALVALIALAFVSMLPNLRSFELTLEEPRRALVAYEMWFSGTYLQPTLLGEPYFNKPPLFNWLVIFASALFGWGGFAVRVVSLTFTALTALLVYLTAKRLIGDRNAGLLAALIYVAFADNLYHYGWIGEIDATLTFFVFGTMLCLWSAFETGKNRYLVLAGLNTGLTFLLKGFPAYAFFVLTLAALAVRYRRYRLPFTAASVAAYAASLAAPAAWILGTDAPSIYLHRLFFESLSRAAPSHGVGEVVLHLASYPLLTIKQLLPLSVVIPFLLWKEKPALVENVRGLLLMAGVNYAPYWLSVGSRGRYVLPLFPLAALAFAYLLHAAHERWKTLALVLIAAAVVGRFGYGLVGFPWMMEKRGSLRVVGQDIARRLDGESRVGGACAVYALVYYVNVNAGVRVTSETALGDWRYLVSCEGARDGRLLAEYTTRRHTVFLYARRSADFPRDPRGNPAGAPFRPVRGLGVVSSGGAGLTGGAWRWATLRLEFPW